MTFPQWPFTRSVLIITSSALISLADLEGIGEDAPYPFPIPVRYTFVLGDPERGPEPDPQYLPLDLEWDEERVRETVNTGHPYRDYGHFRLKTNAVYSVSNGNGLSELTDEEILEALDRYEPSQPWSDGDHVHYSLLRPPEEATMPVNGWPLVVYCPGVGAVGRKEIPRPVLSPGYADQVPNEAVWATDYFRLHYPGYVVVMHPQGRTVEYGRVPYERTPVLYAYLEVIDHLVAAEPIDPHRLYPIGFSMGGATVWQLLLERPDFFAAAVPLAGNPFSVGNPEAALLRNIPIWMQIGNRDTWNGSARYLQAYQQLEDLGAPYIRFWEIQDLRHEAYPLNSLHVPEWLFAQRLRPPPVVLEAVQFDREASAFLQFAFTTTGGFSYHLQKGSGDPGSIEWNDVPESRIEGTGERVTLRHMIAPEEENGAHWFRILAGGSSE